MSQDIQDAVYAAIDDVNQQSPDGPLIAKSLDTALLGGGGIDSLVFVNLVVAVEEQIQNRFGESLILVNEDTLVREEHPFRTVGSLVEYVKRLLPAQV